MTRIALRIFRRWLFEQARTDAQGVNFTPHLYQFLFLHSQHFHWIFHGNSSKEYSCQDLGVQGIRCPIETLDGWKLEINGNESTGMFFFLFA
jgi:hypothetical protein